MNKEPYESLCAHYHVCERQEYCNGEKCSDYEEEKTTGEWEEKTFVSCGNMLRWRANVIEQKCSICKRWSLKWSDTIQSNYCSHCGAKMEV